MYILVTLLLYLLYPPVMTILELTINSFGLVDDTFPVARITFSPLPTTAFFEISGHTRLRTADQLPRAEAHSHLDHFERGTPQETPLSPEMQRQFGHKYEHRNVSYQGQSGSIK